MSGFGPPRRPAAPGGGRPHSPAGVGRGRAGRRGRGRPNRCWTRLREPSRGCSASVQGAERHRPRHAGRRRPVRQRVRRHHRPAIRLPIPPRPVPRAAGRPARAAGRSGGSRPRDVAAAHEPTCCNLADGASGPTTLLVFGGTIDADEHSTPAEPVGPDDRGDVRGAEPGAQRRRPGDGGVGGRGRAARRGRHGLGPGVERSDFSPRLVGLNGVAAASRRRRLRDELVGELAGDVIERFAALATPHAPRHRRVRGGRSGLRR